MSTPTYVTPTYITELFHFVTYAEVLLTLIRLVTTMRFNCKETPTNETDYWYSCHLIGVELVQPITWTPYLAALHH